MAQGQFQPIYPNPYIVGNPIRSREMFFGRVDEFNYIARELDNGQRTALIVLFGERRSGKSSILYQVLNGQLGAAFLPIFVDMQLMAGISTEAEFFGRIIADTGKALGKEGLEITSTILRPDDANPAEKFHQFLRLLKERFPGRAPLLLIDEYEILENKISEGCLSRHVLTFFGGLLESEQVSFVFTGSKKLEQHNPELWGSGLMRRAVSRKISFLTRDDTARLVTLPLANQVRFAPEVLEQIYALTAGQPFYTQLICQNLVYHLNEVKKYFVESKDLETVVSGILENPPPQLIFNWGEHAAEHKLALALLAEFSKKPGLSLSTTSLRHRIKQSKLDIVLSDANLKTWLTDLVRDEYLLQQDYRFAFRLDLFRRWIRHDHNIWQVKKEIGPEELERICEREREKKEQKKKIIIVLERVALAVAVVVVVYLGFNYFFSTQRKVKIKANGGPFIVKIDGDSMGTTIAEDDSTLFVVAKLRKGKSYDLEVMLLASKESRRRNVEIIEDNQEIAFMFPEFPLTIVSDAARLSVGLGGLAFPNKNQSASWRYTLNATAGRYQLKAWPAQSEKSSAEAIDTTITIPTPDDSIYLDFPNRVVITLRANAPFTYNLEGNGSKVNQNQFASVWSADSTVVTLRGCPKDFYQFTFSNPRTGQAIPRTKLINADDSINVNFGDVVNITLRAKTPFLYKALHVQSGKLFNNRLPVSLEVIKGAPKGSYQFTFTNPRANQTMTTSLSIAADKIIPITFPALPAAHRFMLTSNPDSAKVILNDQWVGYTPFDTTLAAGPYAMALEKDGYDRYAFMRVMTKDETVQQIDLARQFGSLSILVQNQSGTSLANVKIYINDELVGETPIFKGKLLPVGKYIVKATHSRYVTASRPVFIKKNETEPLLIKMEEKR